VTFSRRPETGGNSGKAGGVKTNMLRLFIDLQNQLVRALRDEEGQGLAEYALILAFVAIVAILALTFLGVSITSILSSVAKSL
jgi:pilus assembly protein Flp/PilA